jgi:hypothetical protein
MMHGENNIKKFIWNIFGAGKDFASYVQLQTRVGHRVKSFVIAVQLLNQTGIFWQTVMKF